MGLNMSENFTGILHSEIHRGLGKTPRNEQGRCRAGAASQGGQVRACVSTDLGKAALSRPRRKAALGTRIPLYQVELMTVGMDLLLVFLRVDFLFFFTIQCLSLLHVYTFLYFLIQYSLILSLSPLSVLLVTQ